MKLNKGNWKRDRLGVFCLRAKNIDQKKQFGIFNYIDIGTIDSELKRVSEIQNIEWEKASPRARQIIQKGDTLFSTVRVNLERIAFIDFELENTIASTGFTVIRSNGTMIPEYLFYTVSAPNFIERLIQLQKGTAYPAVTDKIVFDQEIVIPPIEEQKQIATLFQSIDASIESIKAQEGNLLKLRTILTTELISSKPRFGDLLNGNCKQVTLGDLAKESRTTSKNPYEEGIERYVGLEHIEPGNLKIQGWGNVSDGTTFTKVFEEGDVLFGRRRAYLKKAAKADFKGLCSGDITVLKANSKNILPELLPYYMSADPVFEFAVSNSAGSLSPRAKWKDLSKMEISLPELEVQKEIIKVFQLLDKNIDELLHQKEILKELKHKLLDEILG
ncbi:MAG: restriction endonuclease subunit S [Bacteroidales bacterium]|nr:restriction endonuclease subunit S [Bacteroidales bacterium]